MEATRALKDVENALRDFIAHTLERALGEGWETQCGVAEERVEKWRERKQIEAKRQDAGVTEERLLYYADFYDIKTILKKHWAQHFKEALGNWKTIEVWLSELEKLRDPDAHRRELLPHQHHLAIGISGEIRTRISRFRSIQETGESYFPRIESVRDSLGALFTAGQNSYVNTGKTLRPGDCLDFVVTASDPLESPLQYSFGFTPELSWQDNNSGSVNIDKAHVGLSKSIFIQIKSSRKFHAHEGRYDDLVIFVYDILPPKN